MFATLLIAATLLASSTPTPAAPAPSPSAVQTVPQAGPMRVVTYNVTWSTNIVHGEMGYGGLNQVQSNHADRGTVSVAVMAIQDENLGVEVTETMQRGGGPFKFKGVISPTGIVTFPAESISEVSRELLRYFATELIPPNDTEIGSTWQTVYDLHVVKVQNQYKVIKIDGDLLTLQSTQQAKFNTFSGTTTSEGTIVLKPSILAPVSGTVRKIIDEFISGDQQREEYNLQFDRVSDSLDSKPK